MNEFQIQGAQFNDIILGLPNSIILIRYAHTQQYFDLLHWSAKIDPIFEIRFSPKI